MFVRLARAPWWVTWMALVAVIAGVYGPVWLLMDGTADGWPLFGFNVVGLSVALATVVLLLQWRVRRSYAAALAGLTWTQQQHAATAMWRGAIPTDPAVLESSIRLILINKALRDRQPRWGKRFEPVLPLVLAANTAISLAAGDRQRSLGYLALSLLMAVLLAWAAYVRRRMRTRLRLLRAAVGPLGADSALTDADYPTPMSMRRRLLFVAVLGLLVALVMGAGFYLFERPKWSCTHAYYGVRDFTEPEDLVYSSAVLPGGPSVTAAQEWSGRIQRQARRVTTGAAASHMQHLADLSQRAVALIRDARNTPNPAQEQTMQRQAAYHEVLSHMYDEANQALDTCQGVT